MTPTITQEQPDSPAASQLIDELDAHLCQFYPVESRHGYSVEKLLRDGVAFFVIRNDGQPAGCAGLLLVGSDYAEIKRMYVRPAHRRRGLARLLLEHLESRARDHNIPRLRLETGIHQHDAIRLYEQFGFVRIPPFGPYREDPPSRCYEKQIR